MYTGENVREETRRKEHQGKVRLTSADIEKGNIEKTMEQMNERDGERERNSTECGECINWEASRIMRRENGRKQGKMLEWSGDDQTEGDGVEGVEQLQPDGTVAVNDVLGSK